MTLRLTEDEDRVLAQLAAQDGISKHEAAARAIADAGARRLRDARVRELSERGRQRYADLLDRLAQ